MRWAKWKWGRLAMAFGVRCRDGLRFIEDCDGRWVPLCFGLFWLVSRETEYLPECAKRLSP